MAAKAKTKAVKKPTGGAQKTAAEKVAVRKAARATGAPAPTAEAVPRPIEAEVPSGEVERGELLDAITREGVYIPAGTKVSALKPALSAAEKDKLERCGLVA